MYRRLGGTKGARGQGRRGGLYFFPTEKEAKINTWVKDFWYTIEYYHQLRQ